MFRTRRHVALGLTAAASVASMIALAVPAQALVPVTPAWPAAGRVPSGCDASIGLSGPNTDWNYTYTDSIQPVVSDTRVSSNATNVTVLPPAGAPVSFNLKVSEPCSGVGAALGYIAHNRVLYTGFSLGNTTTNAFSSWWSFTLANFKPDDAAGVWTMPFALVERRYDGFVLNQDFKVVGSPSTSSTSIAVTGAWANKPSYIVRAMTLANTLSAVKVKKGKTVKATAVLTMATNTGYVADASDKVIVQTKVGAGKWVSNATLTTNASGVVSYTFVLSATTQVRFIHNRVLSGKFTNGIISVIRTVKRA